jgi:hypothetical protein
MRRIIAVIVMAGALAVAGCSSHGGSQAAAKASVSAAATSKQVTEAEQQAATTGVSCLVEAKAIKRPADIVYTIHPPAVTSINTTHHVFTDPGGVTTAFTHCMQAAYKGHWTAIRNCVQASPPALGKGFFGRAFLAFVNCAAKQGGGNS